MVLPTFDAFRLSASGLVVVEFLTTMALEYGGSVLLGLFFDFDLTDYCQVVNVIARLYFWELY